MSLAEVPEALHLTRLISFFVIQSLKRRKQLTTLTITLFWLSAYIRPLPNRLYGVFHCSNNAHSILCWRTTSDGHQHSGYRFFKSFMLSLYSVPLILCEYLSTSSMPVILKLQVLSTEHTELLRTIQHIAYATICYGHNLERLCSNKSTQ